MGELYISACCGAVFVPGHGRDNIFGIDGEAVERHKPLTIGPEGETMRLNRDNAEFWDAHREGRCPACGADDPAMDLVGVMEPADGHRVGHLATPDGGTGEYVVTLVYAEDYGDPEGSEAIGGQVVRATVEEAVEAVRTLADAHDLASVGYIELGQMGRA